MSDDRDLLSLLDEVRRRLVARTNEAAVAVDDPAARVHAVLSGRRRRERIFPSALFADPAWDILLGLYEDELRNRRSFVKDACVVSGVPATTALRWIAVLEREDLVSRDDDLSDQRKVELRLTDAGRRGMEAYFCEP